DAGARWINARRRPDQAACNRGPRGPHFTLHEMQAGGSDEYPRQLVELFGHTPGLRHQIRQRHDGDIAVAPYCRHPRLLLVQQGGSRSPQPRGPDAVDRRRGAAALEVSENGHTRLEARLLLDPPAERVADAPLCQLHVPEGVCDRFTVQVEAGEGYALGDDDDAEVPAFTTTAVE